MKVEKYNFIFFIIATLAKIVTRREKPVAILNPLKCAKHDDPS